MTASSSTEVLHGQVLADIRWYPTAYWLFGYIKNTVFDSGSDRREYRLQRAIHIHSEQKPGTEQRFVLPIGSTLRVIKPRDIRCTPADDPTKYLDLRVIDDGRELIVVDGTMAPRKYRPSARLVR